MKKHFKLLAATIAALALTLTGCSASTGSSTSQPKSQPKTQQTVKLLTNYFAQAEQGGYWDAMKNQYAKKEGVTLDVTQGGPGIATVPQVASGSYQFGVGNADDIITARKSGLPVVAVAGIFDTSLFVMMSHKSANITNFSELNGHQVSARIGAPYWSYLKKKFKLDKVKLVNFTGNIATFKSNKNLVQQGYATSDVYRVKQAGIDVNVLSVAKDGGYNPYGLLLFTTENMITTKPDVVKAVTAASVEGWKHFLQDPADGQAAIMKANTNMAKDVMEASTKIIANGDYVGTPIGKMTSKRWNDLRDQLALIGAVPDGFDVSNAWTNKFLPSEN